MTSRSEILARLAAATPGPWQEVVRTVVRVESGGRLGAPVGHCDSLRDAELIAHAPDDLRHLLDVIDRYEDALRAIAANDELVAANPDAFSIHAVRRMQEQARLALGDEAKAGAA